MGEPVANPAEKPPWLRSQSSVELDVTQLQRVASSPVATTSAPHPPLGSVSEKSTVYWDLSKADDNGDLEMGNLSPKMKAMALGDKLEEESVVRVVETEKKLLTSSHCKTSLTIKTTSVKEGSPNLMREEKLPPPPCLTKQVSLMPPELDINSAKSPIQNDESKSILSKSIHGSLYSNPQLSLKEDIIRNGKKVMLTHVKKLFASSIVEQAVILREILNEVANAWAMPVIGREIATLFCGLLHEQGVLKLIVKNLEHDDYDVKLASADLLSQCLTTQIRTLLAEEGLEVVVNLAKSSVRDLPLLRASLGILEHMFKVSDSHCFRAIQLDGLKPVLYGCSLTDVTTLRLCAKTLANLALFGGPLNQVEMARRHVPDWLFPLAFGLDPVVKYYAFFAICALVSNGEVEGAVLKSGTLELVEPFVIAHNPFDFASCDVAMSHGQSPNALKQVVPLLSSSRREPQSLAAFHFAMEAAIKALSQTQSVFSEIGVIGPLERLVCSSNNLASRYAAQALHLIGHTVPKKLSPQTYNWTVEDVLIWLRKYQFSETIINSFANVRVDGDMLLRLTANLLPEVGIVNKVEQMRFLRELEHLRLSADYSPCDPSGLGNWLRSISPELYQYTYPMLHNSVNMECVALLCDEVLAEECGISNSFHRNKIRAKSNNATAMDHPGQWYDVFISYRRSSGSQLASLLKVHLALRKYHVYLDIETLKGGKFAESMLNSIRRSHNFILVLTADALDRCYGDVECKDWVHREIIAALEGGCNIVPVLDQNVIMPTSEMLPADIGALSTYNGCKWIHEMQDACIDLLEQFLVTGPNSPRKKLMPCQLVQTKNLDSLSRKGSHSNLAFS